MELIFAFITWESSAAVAAAIGAVAAAITSWRNSKKINHVQIMVDGRLDEALSRIDQLTEALEGSDVGVPSKPERY